MFVTVASKSKLFIMIEPNEKTPDLMRLCYVACWLPGLIPNKTNSQISGVYVETPLQDKNFHAL